jgi:IS5 family transposase
LEHPLVTLGRTVDWGFLEARFGEVCTDDPGRPPLPTRLMAGLSILKHTYDLSDEALCERWIENPYTSSSAAKSSSSTGWCLIARR